MLKNVKRLILLTMKDRLISFLEYLGIGQNKFESKVGLSIGYINKLKGDMKLSSIEKVVSSYPELNPDWLITGEGSMLKQPSIDQQKAHIEGRHGGIGQITGGKVDIHNNAGKDKVIENQDKAVDQMFQVLIDELHRFYDIGMNHDEHIKNQGEYIASIIKKSYLRNERNMDRIDKIIEQQNELIRMVSEQNKRIQDRADKIVDALILKS
jgi:hypothetical protein